MRNRKLWKCMVALSLTAAMLGSPLAGYLPAQVVVEASESEASDFTLSTDGKTLTKYSGTATNVTIPDGVITIGKEAFKGNKNMLHVTIPDGVELIGEYAFQDCTNLQDVSIPDSVESLGEAAFGGCSQLRTVKLSNKLANLPKDLFKDCGMLSAITIPDSVTTISGGVFRACGSLRSIEIPDSVTTIASYDWNANPYGAFYGCSSLKDVKLPKNITSIEDATFRGCTELASIEIPDGVTNIGEVAFYRCSALTEVKIPDGVTKIGEDAFNRCTSLARVDFPAKLESIGEQAFYNCTALTRVELPEGLRSIGREAFWVSALREAVVPDSVTSIGYRAFDDKNLVVYGDQNTYVERLFAEKSDVTGKFLDQHGFLTDGRDLIGYQGETGGAVEIPDRVRTIKSTAFDGNSNVISVAVGELVSSIEAGAFSGCGKLESIEVSADNQNYSSQEGCLYDKTGTTLQACPAGSTSVELPTGIKTVGSKAFYNCKSLTKLELPEGMESVMDQAFGSCSSLESLAVPEGVTSIGNNVFEGCDSLVVSGVRGSAIHTYVRDKTKVKFLDGDGFLTLGKELAGYRGTAENVTLPDEVTSIGSRAFEGCSVKNIVIPNGVTQIGSRAFSGCVAMESITVPDSVRTIETDAFSDCGDDLVVHGSHGSRIQTYILALNIPFLDNDGFLTVGDRLRAYTGGSENITIPNRVAIIDADVFKDNQTIISVVIPDGVTSIGERAFDDCGKLAAVRLPDSIDKIGADAFYGCVSLTEIRFPSSLKTVGSRAFAGCTALEKADFTYSSQLNSAGEQVFAGCKRLAAVSLPDSVTETGSGMFSGCVSLTSVKLPSQLREIGNEMFTGCAALTSLQIPDGATAIGDYALSGCSVLAEIKVSDRVESLGAGVFSGCTSLKKLVIGSGVTSIGEGAFDGCTELAVSGFQGSCTENYLAETEIPFTDEQGFETVGHTLKKYTGVAADVVIPSRVTVIEVGAFPDSQTMEKLVIHKDVTEIGTGAFSGCSSLEKIEVASENSAYASDGGCLYNSRKNVLLVCPRGISEVQLAGTLEKIEEHAFENCSKLKELKLPDTARIIGTKAFSGCAALASLWIPESVEEIAEDAFTGCQALAVNGVEGSYVEKYLAGTEIPFTDEQGMQTVGHTFKNYTGEADEVVIPSRATVIEAGVFQDSRMMKKLVIHKDVEEIGTGAFSGCSSLEEIEVASGNSVYASDGGCLYNSGKTVLLACPCGISSVQPPETLERVGEHAFENCSRLEELMLPDTTQIIDSRAFSGCMRLASLWIPESVQRIAADAFNDCPALVVSGVQGSYVESYLLGTKVPFMDDKGFVTVGNELRAYAGTEVIIIIPVKISVIGSRAFADSISLEGVTLSGNVTEIRDHAFVDCPNLSKVVLEGNTQISKIGDGAFEGSRKVVLYGNELNGVLQSYAEQNNLTSIQDGADSMQLSLTGNTEVSREMVADMQKANQQKDASISVNVGDGKWLQYVFKKGTMTKPVEKENCDFGAELIGDYSALIKPAFDKEGFAFAVRYSYEGELPGKAEIHIPVGTEWAGRTLYYYEVTDGGEYNLIGKSAVTASGEYTVTQEHCSYYVALTEEFGKKAVTTGDADGNGKVNIADAQLILKAALNLTALKPEYKDAADVNHDGKITIADAQMVLKAALNLIKL